MDERPAPPDPGVPQRVGSWGEVIAYLILAAAVVVLLLFPGVVR